MTENGPPDARDLEIQALREKVSQLEAARERLGEANALYHSTIDAIIDGMHIISPDYRIQLFNASFAHWCERLGLSTDPVGQDLFTMFPFLPDCVREEYRQVMETGKTLVTEEHNTVGGEEIVTETRKIPLGKGGNIEHVLTVVRDITERKQAAATLQESEHRFRAIFDRAADGMLLADPVTMTFIIGNPKICEMLGYSPDEITTLGFADIHPAESLPGIRAEFDRQLRAEITLAEDIPVKRKDGSVFLADVSAARISLDGRPYLMGSFRDVTKQKQAQRALRESEERYRTLVESAGEAIFTMDEEPRYLFMNGTAAERLGGRPEDFVGKTMWDVFPKPVADSQALMIQKAIRTGQGSLSESVTQIQGRPRWYETSIEPVQDEQGRVMSALVIARDVTEREQAERRYRAIIEASVDGFWIIDAEGRLLEVNDALAGMLGYEPEELVGMSISTLEAKETPQEVARHMRRIAERGSDRFETRHRRKDGEAIDMDISSNYLDIEGGQFFVFVRDITDRKRAEREIQRVRARLVTAREQERRRLAGELHDSIGQSLVALQLTVRNTAAMVHERLNAEQTAALVNATAQCTELIRDVRHICHGLYPPILESLGLVAGLRQLARDVENAGMAASLQCSKAIEARRFSNDVEIALFRIAQEAVTNAIRHGECEEIGIVLRQRRDEVHLTVEDDGVGFAPEEAVGNGLGLTHMRERAQAAGGTLAIRSKKGRTRVEAVLPDRPPGEDNDPPPLAIGPASE